MSMPLDAVPSIDAIPKLAQIRAGIRNPDAFRPPPRYLGGARLDILPDGYANLTLPGHAPRRIHPMVVEAHRALEAGDPIERIVERAQPLWDNRGDLLVERVVRTYIHELWEAGVVEIPFDEPPAVFAGRYERVGLIGRGGHGLIHLCRDLERGGAPVAVKHAVGWLTRIEKCDRMTRVEAAALAMCDHPLLPKLHDAFEIDGVFHLVREVVDGKPLTKLPPGLDDATRLAIARDVCGSVGHLHERGLLFLGVKLENFIYSAQDGRTRLLDLAYCRRSNGDAPVTLRKALGTRAYVAPEVLAKLEASPRSDIYGVGRALFMLATGETPRQKWGAEDLAARMRAAGRSEREAALVAWCTAEDPARRPASLQQVVAELDALRPGENP